eukprot:jgi/Chrzof1/2196/Cz11g06010.t1
MVSVDTAHLQKVASLLFELELEDLNPALEQMHDASLYAAKETVARLSTPRSLAHHKLLRDATRVREAAKSLDGSINIRLFAELLACRGYFAWLRTGRVDNSQRVKALRHTFVVVSLPGDGIEHLYVVDPCFKDQFKLANPTPYYTSLLSVLPDLFVGAAEDLAPLVEFLCAEMKVAFLVSGGQCPPWRQASFMMTKWLPSAADDLEVM